MAGNTKIWPIFRWANWWLSDDLFTGRQFSFYSSNDMEIREDAKSIFPKPVPAYADASTKIDVWDWSSGKRRIINITYSSSNAWWLVCSTRSIFLVKNSDNSVITLCTFTSEDICDLEIFNWYIYVSTRTHLYYKTDDEYNWGNMASANSDTSLSYWVMSQTLQDSAIHPLYASDICMVVWDKNKIWKVKREIQNLLQVWFTIQDWFSVRFINELWWYIRIIANDVPYWSEVLLWDKVSNIATEIIPLEWFHIIGAAIYGWYHYLLSDKWLWLLNWYQYYILKKAPVNDITNVPKNPMCVYDDKIYLIANNALYIYWAKNKNYADVLNIWHKEEIWIISGLWAIWTGTNQWIMIGRDAYLEWWNYTPISVWKDYWLATTWEIQTMCYFWTSMSEIKQAMYLRVWYHIPKEWTNSGNIHIYYRTEADATSDNPENWSWHELTKKDWLYADWDMRSPFATTLKIPENARFQWIQFKFVLTNCVWTDDAWTHTKDTNLYSADLYYNTMLD